MFRLHIQIQIAFRKPVNFIYCYHLSIDIVLHYCSHADIVVPIGDNFQTNFCTALTKYCSAQGPIVCAPGLEHMDTPVVSPIHLPLESGDTRGTKCMQLQCTRPLCHRCSTISGCFLTFRLVPAPVDRTSANAWLYKTPWITCQEMIQAHQWP